MCVECSEQLGQGASAHSDTHTAANTLQRLGSLLRRFKGTPEQLATMFEPRLSDRGWSNAIVTSLRGFAEQ